MITPFKTILLPELTYASSAVHSALDVGLERAKMIGALLKVAISRIISGVNTCSTIRVDDL